MAVRVSDLVRQVSGMGIKLVAGKDGLSNIVDWIHVVANMENASFLKGGELVFITGIGLDEETSLYTLIRTIVKNNASAVIVNIGPYIKDIPKEVIKFANEKDFPVFTVPWEVYLADMMRVFYFTIQQKEQRQLELTTAFKYCLFTPEKEDLYVPLLMQKGYSINGKYTVAAIEPAEVVVLEDDKAMYTTPEQDRLKYIAKKWSDIIHELKNDSVAFMEHDIIIAILPDMPEQDTKVLLQKALKRAKESLKWNETSFTGIGSCVNKVCDIAKSYKLAKMTAGYLKLECIENEVTGVSDMGIAGLLFNIEDKEQLSAYCDRTIQPLIEYDEINGTNLVEVLKVYIKHNGSVYQVADEMYIHRNTVNYKINKIAQITGKDITDFNVRSELITGIIAEKICRL